MSDPIGDLGPAARATGKWFATIYDDLHIMAESSESELRDSRGTKAVVTERDLRAVQPAAAAFLRSHEIPMAAGIVVGPGVIENKDGSIDFWRRSDSGTTQRIVFNLSPDDPGFYDFVTYEWFAEVVATGKPAIQGPYLDYAGMDKYILTAMVPLSLDGVLIGTAGCDVEVRELERVIMPILRTIPGDAALVSKFDRIILGNSGRFLVGNRVVTLPKDAIRHDVPGPELGLQLVAAPPARHF
jgi:hypothetical protein